MRVPFIDLQKQYANLKNDLDLAVLNVLKEGNFIMGKPVHDFEKHISEYLGQKSLSCASGTDSLLLALMALGIKEGDEVITTPFTFFATAGVIARLGATPVFVDIDEDTFNIDAEKIEKTITKKTKAILPVHLFGTPADMDRIMLLAKKHNLAVIEDACQAIGAKYRDKMIGCIGDFGCFSFFPTKNLGGAGDGGLVTCNSAENFVYLQKARVHGAAKKYHHDFVGINSRLDTLQAAILDVKYKYLDEWNNKRIAIAQKYNKGLDKTYKTPRIYPDMKQVFHQYAIRIDGNLRDKLAAYLKERDIESSIYYPVPLHLQECFTELCYKKGDFPVAEKICDEILSLPIFPEMTDEQIDFVINTMNEFLKKDE